MQRTETCKNCKYWDQYQEPEHATAGDCRKKPPVVFLDFSCIAGKKVDRSEMVPGVTTFPDTKHDVWCGEWQYTPAVRVIPEEKEVPVAKEKVPTKSVPVVSETQQHVLNGAPAGLKIEDVLRMEEYLRNTDYNRRVRLPKKFAGKYATLRHVKWQGGAVTVSYTISDTAPLTSKVEASYKLDSLARLKLSKHFKKRAVRVIVLGDSVKITTAKT